MHATYCIVSYFLVYKIQSFILSSEIYHSLQEHNHSHKTQQTSIKSHRGALEIKPRWCCKNTIVFAMICRFLHSIWWLQQEHRPKLLSFPLTIVPASIRQTFPSLPVFERALLWFLAFSPSLFARILRVITSLTSLSARRMRVINLLTSFAPRMRSIAFFTSFVRRMRVISMLVCVRIIPHCCLFRNLMYIRISIRMWIRISNRMWTRISIRILKCWIILLIRVWWVFIWIIPLLYLFYNWMWIRISNRMWTRISIRILKCWIILLIMYAIRRSVCWVFIWIIPLLCLFWFWPINMPIMIFWMSIRILIRILKCWILVLIIY